MESILDDPKSIKGIIYLIEHTSSGKKYVGQTLSHRLNRGRYRPFGAIGRFHDHTSAATRNTKKNQCSYLYNAMRLYGCDAFKMTELESCDRETADSCEQHYISHYKTLYPNGYNLTTGGRSTRFVANIANETPLNTPQKRGGCKFRTEETRQKMSARAIDRGFTEVERQSRMQNAQNMHAAKRKERFKDVTIDPTKIDEYIFIRKGRLTVDVDGCTANFMGKYESEEALRNKAKEFLLSLLQATLPNCSGNP